MEEDVLAEVLADADAVVEVDAVVVGYSTIPSRLQAISSPVRK